MNKLFLLLPAALLVAACDNSKQSPPAKVEDKSVTQEAPEKTTDSWQETKQAAGTMVDKAAEATRETYQDIKAGAADTYQDVKASAAEAYEDSKEAAASAYEATKEAAKDSYEAAKDQAEDTWQTIKEKAKDN